MPIDPRQRFGITAERYERYRPSYPADLIEWIARATGHGPGATLVDLGAGTGISTRFFANAGYVTIGVEPNATMLERARRAGGPKYVRGDAAATGLRENTAHLIAGAQAWHWFDIAATWQEIARIARADAFAVAIWNGRADTPLLRDYEALLQSLPDYGTVPKPQDAFARLCSHAGPPAASTTLPHRQTLPREALHGRALSSSYVAHSAKQQPTFLANLDALFDRHAADGVVAFDYRTEAHAWPVGQTP